MRKTVFVFDLDFTLWDAGGTWCDATNPPYRWCEGRLVDRSNRWIRLYPEVEQMLIELHSREKFIVAASRTYQPDWANDLLRLFDIDRYFHLKEIYPADKTKHFKNIQQHFNLPYSDMVFFDDEYRNIVDVEELGVKSVYVDGGITRHHLEPFL
jgi:magnesium-dependent phosphatase 1